MNAIVEFVKNKKCNLCSSMDDSVDDSRPFLIQVNFIRICKACIDKMWKMSEGIED